MASQYQRTLGTHGSPLWTMPPTLPRKPPGFIASPGLRAITPTMNTLQLPEFLSAASHRRHLGVAFVAQSVGMDYVGPYTFTCVRSFIGGLFSFPASRCSTG